MILLMVNENFRHKKSRSTTIKTIALSEISFDMTGVTLHYRIYQDPDLKESVVKTTINDLKRLFPDHYVEEYQCRITLGEFIDLVSKIV